jgi:hypothetical protein
MDTNEREDKHEPQMRGDPSLFASIRVHSRSFFVWVAVGAGLRILSGILTLKWDCAVSTLAA